MTRAIDGIGSGMAGELCLGPFTADRRGMLSPSSRDRFPAFTVQWQGRTVRARLLPGPGQDDGDGSARLEFTARLGYVPSTAAAPARSVLRGGALRMLRELPGLAPAGWQIFVRPDHSVEVTADSPITLPISAVSLVTEVTLFLLDLSPYLVVLDADGVGVGTEGIVKT